ncbi:uncharacterized protein [Clytia hemisphaerica]|uniref:Ion transport domain-containing protein n=1 Tax=Clytia hemisphaerica TaxID=252671 RepID=A0A7M6DJU0_9CNID
MPTAGGANNSGVRGFFTNFANYTGEKVSEVKELLFGVNIDDSVELASLTSRQSNSFRSRNGGNHDILKRKTLIPDELQHEDIYEQYAEYDCSRNLVVSSTTLFRKGPIPIEHLSHQEQNRLSKRGCLLEWNDAQRQTSDNHLPYIDPSSKSLLTYFARMGSGEDDTDVVNLAFVESLLNAGASMNYPDVYGQSIFFAVVRDWHIDVARFAIEKGADVNHRDQYGRTPLHLAAAVNYEEMVAFIIANGADITAKTEGEEQTPLHYAARYDSVEAMKVLIQAGAMIDGVDFLNRTPLHVAAETGSHEVVKFLMKLGAPTGVYDSFGNSVMFMMIEKMPHLAYEGLNQFFVEDNAMRRRYYYLDHLEFDVKSNVSSKNARNVLEAIVMYKEVDLMMHPSIKKLLSIKWKLYGKRRAIISNLGNVFHTLLATILIFAIPYRPYDQQFTPVKDNIIFITLAMLFVVLTFFFWIKQILTIRLLNAKDQAYKEHRFNYIKKQLPHCHPRWTEEKEFLEKEIERIKSYKSTFWQDYWNIFEWVSLLFVVIMFALHITNIVSPNMKVYRAANFVSAITLLLVWFRLYKTLRIARFFSEINVLLTNVALETCRFVILYMDLYIPYIFVFFMLFGGSTKLFGNTKKNIDENHFELEQFSDVLYYGWLVMLGKHFPEEGGTAVNHVALELFLGSYIVISTLLGFIYIGRLSELFSRVYKKVNAKSNLLVAGVLVTEEKYLSQNQLRANKKHMRRLCGPMVVPFESNKGVEDDDQNIGIGIEHVTSKIEDVTNYLRKANFPREERQSINVDQLTVLETELERIFQSMSESERLLTENKENVKTAQTKTIDLIKETIETRKTNANRK